MTILAIGEITIANIDDINISTTEPLDPVLDQLWLDTGQVPNIMKRWNGGAWEQVSPSQQDMDVAIDAAKDYAEQKAAEAQEAAEAVAYSEAEQQAAEALAAAEEAAQGYVSEETQARLDQAEADLEAAKVYADEMAAAAEEAARAYAEEQAQGAVDEMQNQISQYMTYDTATGLKLGAQGSPSQIVIDNLALQFLDLGGEGGGSGGEEFIPHPDAVAYLHGQKFYVANIEALSSLLVGNHLIEKYDENVTLIRWVG